jgi:hypothetical protein
MRTLHRNWGDYLGEITWVITPMQVHEKRPVASSWASLGFASRKGFSLRSKRERRALISIKLF